MGVEKEVICPITGAKATRKAIPLPAISIYTIKIFDVTIEYGITTGTESNINLLSDLEKRHLFFLIKEHSILHDTTIVLSDYANDTKDNFVLVPYKDFLRTFPTLEDIPYRTLRLYAKMSEIQNEYFSQRIFIIRSLNGTQMQGDGWLFFSRSPDTVESIISFLHSINYINVIHSRDAIVTRIRPEGIAFVKGYIGESKNGFVAMKFGDAPKWEDEKNKKVYEEIPKERDDFYDNQIAPAIKSAGYEPTRIDRIDHNKKIDDEILAQIRKAKFVVCDLTYSNLGAYYEAGFAQGLGKQVFFICEKNYFESKGSHFDINHHVTILYEKTP